MSSLCMKNMKNNKIKYESIIICLSNRDLARQICVLFSLGHNVFFLPQYWGRFVDKMGSLGL